MATVVWMGLTASLCSQAHPAQLRRMSLQSWRCTHQFWLPSLLGANGGSCVCLSFHATQMRGILPPWKNTERSKEPSAPFDHTRQHEQHVDPTQETHVQIHA